MSEMQEIKFDQLLEIVKMGVDEPRCRKYFQVEGYNNLSIALPMGKPG